MTFKDLQKLVQSQSGPEQSQLLERLRDKSFWIWNQQQHRQEDIRTKGDCCFNHIIGLPRKDNKEKPMFDYEKLLYDSLLVPDVYNPLKHTFNLKHLWVKKATGLGVTEFFLRFMAWLCLRNNSYRNSQMCIVTGPNQELAIKLIKRMKGLFEEKLSITFDSKETVLELNGCSIEAYPSNHLDAFRSLTNPKFILLDEADFFRKYNTCYQSIIHVIKDRTENKSGNKTIDYYEAVRIAYIEMGKTVFRSLQSSFPKAVACANFT